MLSQPSWIWAFQFPSSCSCQAARPGGGANTFFSAAQDPPPQVLILVEKTSVCPRPCPRHRFWERVVDKRMCQRYNVSTSQCFNETWHAVSQKCADDTGGFNDMAVMDGGVAGRKRKTEIGGGFLTVSENDNFLRILFQATNNKQSLGCRSQFISHSQAVEKIPTASGIQRGADHQGRAIPVAACSSHPSGIALARSRKYPSSVQATGGGGGGGCHCRTSDPYRMAFRRASPMRESRTKIRSCCYWGGWGSSYRMKTMK